MKNQSEWSEELAVIRNVAVGINDRKTPEISFTAHFISGSTVVSFPNEIILSFLREVGLRNVLALEGKVCVVAIEPINGMAQVEYRRMFNK